MTRPAKLLICIPLILSLTFPMAGFAEPVPSPAEANTIPVKTVDELLRIPERTVGGNVTVLLEDGDYTLSDPLTLTGNNITIKSRSGNPAAVILRGGFKAASIFRLAGKQITVQDLSVGQTASNGIVIQGETNADNASIRNVRFFDSREAMLRASSDETEGSSDNCLVENCTFEALSTAVQTSGIAGIHVQKGRNWTIRNNTFRNIAAGSGQLSGGAIGFRSGAQTPTIENNRILRCDRGILMSTDGTAVTGGLVRNNMIHTTRDTGIYLANADGAKVVNNTIYIDSAYPNAIEYRFSGTRNVSILNNLTNRPITKRNFGSAYAEYNFTAAQSTWFTNAAQGDLHLASPIHTVVNKAKTTGDVLTDLDGQPRVSGKYDLGADELDDSLLKLPVSLTLNTDRTALRGNNVESATLYVTGKYPDGTVKAVTPDNYICYDAAGNPLAVTGSTFHTYRAGTYTLRAVVDTVQSNAVTFTVKPEDIARLQATGLRAVHYKGQTFLTWDEINPIISADSITGRAFHAAKNAFPRRIVYRIYRSAQPITYVNGMTPIAQVGALSGWDQYLYGIETPNVDNPLYRYVIPGQNGPLPVGTGLYVFRPNAAGNAYYAVTAVVDGKENLWAAYPNSLQSAVSETAGQGVPILQRVVNPDTFLYTNSPTLYYYTRWESPPNASVIGQATDYLVGIPPKTVSKAAVGIHLHCWGGSMESGYGWWTNAEQGAILLASNMENTSDWWTGHHERVGTVNPPVTQKNWQEGVVHPYTSNRLFAFVDWMKNDGQWDIDPTKTFIAGTSMGGSGSIMNAIRYGEKLAWCRSWVGVHIPEESNQASAYQLAYGPPAYGALFEDGTRVWDYYNDDWFLRQYPQKETAFITFCNAKNDTLIGWPQAVKFYKALQDTKRPHMFFWGQNGHGQRTLMPMNLSEKEMPLDLRTNQSQPAFTHCTLDDDPGDGTPESGAAVGQVNGYLYWKPETIVDLAHQWEMVVALTAGAPKDTCKVDLTPRRCQQFKAAPGTVVKWFNNDGKTGLEIESGQVTADGNGLITMPQITVSKSGNKIILQKP